MKHEKFKTLPSKLSTISFTNNLVHNLFPFIDGGRPKSISRRKLEKQLKALLKTTPTVERYAQQELAKKFMLSLDSIKEQLLTDATFIEGNDPATTCVEEVVMTYPGFLAIAIYRLANRLKTLGVPLIPRIMTEYAHSQTGIDIHPGASIESPFFIDHGTGIVIGESAVIGKRVKLYQGVTIGALSVSKELARVKRHPTIEDDVVIYAGATILGGKTTIGMRTVVGGNVWLTESVPPFSIVQHDNKVRITTRDYSLS